MTKTFPPALAVPTANPPLRRIFRVLRLALGLLILSAMITQIVDQVTHDAFKPVEYFAYFTIESSMMNVVVLLVGGLFALRMRRDTELFTSVRVAIFSYAVVTGAVYNLLLRGIPATGYAGLQWPNEIMHVWIPIFIVIDWFVVPGRARAPWRQLWLVISYPIAWLVFTMVRGAVSGWYPYPFLEPSGRGGVGSVLVYIVGIAAFIIAIASIAIGLSRIGVRRRVDQ
ncbi:Pr6Pr family membrane protein [Glaciihabitans sp. UYNi722]|uniref:Pr6Pr family membrane protein n=1 Tax=Glaciihabitans sp. UYNi722 TaxID=3156344 RepID=UPI00339AE06D